MHDRLSDMITRIRNAYLVGKKEVILPHTKLLENVARVMVEYHYLAALKVEAGSPSPQLVLTLLYAGRKPAITSLRRLSKPGVRIYRSFRSLRPVLSGMGLAILTTSQGVMSDQRARRQKLGGEVLVELW